MGSWPWNASARSETRPGRVKGGSPPGDHRAGDPPCLAGAAGPDLPARLPILPGSLEAITGDVNGVVLVCGAKWMSLLRLPLRLGRLVPAGPDRDHPGAPTHPRGAAPAICD